MSKQNQIIGDFKQFITIERRELNTLQELANELMDKGSKIEDAAMYQKGIGINYAIEWIKENNIYNKEFEIKG